MLHKLSISFNIQCQSHPHCLISIVVHTYVYDVHLCGSFICGLNQCFVAQCIFTITVCKCYLNNVHTSGKLFFYQGYMVKFSVLLFYWFSGLFSVEYTNYLYIFTVNRFEAPMRQRLRKVQSKTYIHIVRGF